MEDSSRCTGAGASYLLLAPWQLTWYPAGYYVLKSVQASGYHSLVSTDGIATAQSRHTLRKNRKKQEK